MKLRGTFFVIWKMLDCKYYRYDTLKLTNGVEVPLRFTIGRRAGSSPRALSREGAGSKPLLFIHCLFEKNSRKFLVNRKVMNPFANFCSNC